MISVTRAIQSPSDESGRHCMGHPLEPRAFRDTLGLYASGIAIIAGHNGVEPLGFTCQSFYSVSIAPPLISFSVMANSSTYPQIREQGNSRSTFSQVRNKRCPTSSLAR